MRNVLLSVSGPVIKDESLRFHKPWYKSSTIGIFLQSVHLLGL